MASLLSSGRLGNTNTSSLIRSASSLQNQVQIYQDDVQALTYANSAYTDDAFASYQAYLSSRIDRLNSTGSIADATKALTLTKTLESATKSNISASITRENIQIMAGNASLQDKYNLIVSQYQRAMGIGDLTLAQTLEKQAYDVSQSIQYQAVQAADASATLAKAGNGRTTGTTGVTYQNEVATNLTEGLKYLNGLAKNTSEKEMNAKLGDYVKQATPTLNALGVHIDAGQQPNYWDVVYGVAGAIYNAKVLRAQAEAPINPLVAQTYASEAAGFLSGQSKIQTLAGNLTVQEIQQAQQDPHMFAFDNSTGSYKRTTQTGYQYMDFTDASGNTSKQLVPTYSGIVGEAASNKVYFLSPQETTMMTKLGLNFHTDNKTGSTGDGAQVQVTQNSPQWLKSLLGENGVTNMFTDKNGFISFKGASSSGQGDSYYTLAMDAKGLHGLYERLPDGSSNLVGGDYGFNGSAISLLINQGQQLQQSIQVAQAKAQATLQLQQQQAQQSLKVAPAPAPVASPNPTTQLQPATYAPQLPTYNPQQASPNSTNILQPAGQIHSNVQGVPLTQPHLNGIRL